MSTENSNERIKFLEKRVEELQKELASAKSPRIFLKVFSTLILLGACFCVWKSWPVLKWLLLTGIIWLFFGNTISNAWNSACEYIGETREHWRAESKAEDEHEREMERLLVETETANRRVKAEADADNSRVTTEANAKTQVIKAEEKAKQSAWERDQAGKRNDAVNDAIRAGTWHSNTPEVQPHYSAPVSTAHVTREKDGNKTRVVVRF